MELTLTYRQFCELITGLIKRGGIQTVCAHGQGNIVLLAEDDDYDALPLFSYEYCEDPLVSNITIKVLDGVCLEWIEALDNITAEIEVGDPSEILAVCLDTATENEPQLLQVASYYNPSTSYQHLPYRLAKVLLDECKATGQYARIIYPRS